MKNTALLVFILSFLLVSCGDDSSSSVNDSNEEAEISSSSSSKANKNSKSSSSSSVKSNKSSKTSSSSSEKANNNSKSSSSSSEKNEKVTKGIQDWKDTTEGTLRKSDISDTIYIFDNKKWRIATLPEASLGACNEKSVSFFGYAEERQGQDSSGYYICLKSNNKFYWERIRVRYFEDYVDSIYYDYICNDSSYYANSKAGDAHWGNIVQKNCINCKQENFDYWEKICKKRCYVLDGANPFYQKEQKRNNGWREGDFSECALGLGGCTESRIGTIKEGPAIIKSHTNGFSIDSTQKGTYVCWYNYDYDGLQWHEAVDLENNFYYDIFPAECTYDLEGQIISGKKHKYVCDDERLRIATQEEIDAGFACTSYLRYQKKCDIEEKE